jgi:predicted dehydrogenase
LNTRVLVVGCGLIGRRHARILRSIGVSDLALCDPDDHSRCELERELAVQESYAEYERALEHGFTCVFICTPPALHILQARQAVLAGCDVFLEKPLADRLEGVDELLELADQKGRVLMVGLCMRFHKALLRVKEHLERGSIGRLVSIRSEMAVYLPDRWPNLGYRNAYVSQPGCGVTLDYLHEIDIVQWMANSPVSQVVSLTGKLSDLEMQADDTAEILLKFESGAMAEVHLNLFRRPKERRAEFMGTEGTICVDYANWDNPTVQIYQASVGHWEREVLPMERDDIYIAEDREFLRCVETREIPALSGQEGKKSLAIAMNVMNQPKDKTFSGAHTSDAH